MPSPYRYHWILNNIIIGTFFVLFKSFNSMSFIFKQRESFRCYRTDIADTIMYCYNILREVLLEKMLKHVDEASSLNLQVSMVQHQFKLLVKAGRCGLMDRALDSGDRGHGFKSRSHQCSFLFLLVLSPPCELSLYHNTCWPMNSGFTAVSEWGIKRIYMEKPKPIFCALSKLLTRDVVLLLIV